MLCPASKQVVIQSSAPRSVGGRGVQPIVTDLSPESDRLYSEDGVDLSLIRWMLSMTPTERLQTLQQNIRSIMRLRNAKANSRFLGNPEDSVSEKDKAIIPILHRTL